MPRPEPVSAHALLVEQHAFLRRLARSLVADPERADDLAQDVALLALRRPPRATGSPRAWLARVLRNRAVSVARGETRRRDREAQLPERNPPPTPPELEQRWRVQRAVVEAVGRLDEPYRQVLLLRYDRDLSPTAIAEHLGIPVSTVKTRHARALARLRRDLDEHEGPGTPTWSAVLLAGLDDLRPSAATTAIAAGGAMVGAKLAATAAALAVAGLWGAHWVVSGPPAALRDVPEPVAASGHTPATVGAFARHEVEPDRSLSARSALPAPPAARTAPTWSLHVELDGFTGRVDGTAHIEVFDGRAELPASSFDRSLGPDWTIDLGALFADDSKRPGSVRLAVDHPFYLPAEISVLVPDAWRSPSTTSGRLEARLTFVEPKAIVTGEVRLAAEPESVVLGAAIHALRRGQPLEEPVERVVLEAGRRFRLRADHADQHVVVAYVESPFFRREMDPDRGAALRPASRVVTLPPAGQEEFELEPLTLEVGASISGRMVHDSEVDMLVSCSIARANGRRHGPLVWLDGRFENGPSALLLDGNGSFEIHGLAPVEYKLHPSPRWRSNSTDRDTVYRFYSSQDSEVRAVAPARDVLLEFRFVELIFEVYGGGEILPYASLQFDIGGVDEQRGMVPGSHGTDTGPTGRLRVQCDPRHALQVKISDPRFDSKVYRLAESELRPGAEFRLEFEGLPIAMPTLVVSYNGNSNRLARPDRIGFTAWECSARSESEIRAALATSFLSGHGPPWGYDGAIHLARVQWDDRAATWSSDELRPGRYVVAAHWSSHEFGEEYDIVGGNFEVELSANETVYATWSGTPGRRVRFDVRKPDPAGPDVGSSQIVDAEGRGVPVLVEEIGARTMSGYIGRTGSFAVVGPLPAGDYVLELNLRGGGTQRVPFHVHVDRTTEVSVDLGQP